MQGIILAGGTGTRLAPLANAINKHLLPVGNHPMIAHAVRQLAASPDIEGIKIVTNGKDINLFKKALEYLLCPVPINFIIQEKPDGIGGAIKAAFTHPEIQTASSCVVVLGDNLFSEELTRFIKAWKSARPRFQAMCLLCRHGNYEASGVAVLNERKEIANFIEKPKEKVDGYIVPGFYCFDKSLSQVLSVIEPSSRGEYEVTDILDIYLKANTLDYLWLMGQWIDCGTIPDYQAAQLVFKDKEERDI